MKETLGRKIEDLFVLQSRTDEAIAKINERLSALEARMSAQEMDRERVVSEAKSAAGMAGAGVASAVIADVVTRLTRLEVELETKRLPPADR